MRMLLFLFAFIFAVPIAGDSLDCELEFLFPSYDFIICGLGTSGSVVTATLLNSTTSITILALDHGLDRSATFYTQNAFYGNGIPFEYQQNAQYFFSADVAGQQEIIPETFGGSSMINGGLWMRPSIADLASYNDPLWTFNATLADYKTIENFTSSINPDLHGHSGPISVSQFLPDSINQQISQLMQEVFNMPYNPDCNSGMPDGVSIFPRNIAATAPAGIRQDMYTRFVKPLLPNPRLTILGGATVTGIEICASGSHLVSFMVNGTYAKARATKEVILSMGVFESAKHLMLAGIGDCAQLATLGIACTYNNTQVGKNLKDSSSSGMIFVGPAAVNQTKGNIQGIIYTAPDGTGIEVTMTSFPSGIAGVQTYLWLMIQHNMSEVGNATLKANDPFSNMLVYLNHYTENPAQIYDLVPAFRNIRYIMSNLTGFTEIVPGLGIVPAGATDDQIAAYLLETISVEFHTIGSCQLGKVVDSHLRVIGVKNIRVIDNGVGYTLTTHATCATAALIGVHGANFIIQDWGL